MENYHQIIISIFLSPSKSPLQLEVLTVTIMKFLTLSLFILTSFSHNSNGKLSSENEEIVRKWLPLFWLHSEEVFNPTNFDYYISQMQLRDANENVIDPKPTAETLIIGSESQDLHLNTINDISCVHCYDEAFFGLPVDQVSNKRNNFRPTMIK